MQLEIEYLKISALKSSPGNARKHSFEQLARLGAGIEKFGFTNPALIDENNVIIAGHGRVEAARAVGLMEVPCIRLEHLGEAKKTALAIADNKLGELSSFDPARLKNQIQILLDLDFPPELTGFSTAEIDQILEVPDVVVVEQGSETFVEPDPTASIVSRRGDLYALGDHRLLCGDALSPSDLQRLLKNERADMVFTDPPYNLEIEGNVSGLGKIKHGEFAMASGELSSDRFIDFLDKFMSAACQFTMVGSIHFICMDWRHQFEIMLAGNRNYAELKAVCIWNKTNGGMGSFYRSKYENVYVFKNGKAPHVNNIQLGKHGRYRTNVWDYAGVNTFRRGRLTELALHPTVKPVGLVADAIRDCSRRGGLVLDPFIGSGTTILAAQRTGRRARGIEIDPLYVDAAIRRWQDLTGKRAVLADDGRSFDDLSQTRTSEAGNVG
ncbi:MAG: DNA methylase N-4 [Rhizobiales bacterium 65-79]|nr:MAG: DNA methylase N-4 [Rhizobiales bacterium 65-79]